MVEQGGFLKSDDVYRDKLQRYIQAKVHDDERRSKFEVELEARVTKGTYGKITSRDTVVGVKEAIIDIFTREANRGKVWGTSLSNFPLVFSLEELEGSSLARILWLMRERRLW
jgi:hypothetical protein